MTDTTPPNDMPPASPGTDASSAETRITDILKSEQDGQGSNVLSFAALESVSVQNGHAHVSLATSRDNASRVEPLRPRVEAAIASLPGITGATLSFTSHRPATPAAANAPAQGGGHRPFNLGDKRRNAASRHAPETLLPGVKAVIAVASGKGGVGKSTTAVNLAVGLAREGLKTGLLDADIYGPSLPRMLGRNTRPDVVDGTILPIEAWGLKSMSIGYLVDENQAMIWRGPMVMGALTQFLGEVEWGELDVLVIDMPPGTGDAQLTLAQKLGPKLATGGAVIVSTPQDIALLDARRGVAMFERMETPILGVVENMSYFCCPNCNHRTELFGHGGAKAEAEKMGVPFLAEIPLLADIRASGDDGTPIILSAPDSEAAQAYKRLAQAVARSLSSEHSTKEPS
ncbi:Mrp/NBP35 family ATP-binding protein [Gluconobacter albidus]|uniref:Iron-sulfur cluster carrier protein n=1 Tax=Gluconobacter albidus TaxID=318683 RepID=A0AAW3QY70_9PROT|nr:Mrp/NBP35 family ATP-binding protein [Gluconobacter albidus]KXV40596.1 [Fe-S]-binding protein [Gluconobacter albidus]MBS1029385.1 Mrp/NBP35 family ATP-binding protein [Gluconobacter albidus]MCP1274846.1 Mrp/NBP35 family ATP-binding protein [Gluconobacter albidus]GBQ82462.1 iron-sulfur cluster assembly/repair protein ApbC [Gluconobacter albidus NBRC 3250]GLQ67628.1 iron-sulfur cluster carrier protein [Gluconobacter albidus]